MIHLRDVAIPPTANSAYINRPGGRMLTKQGKKYKHEMLAYITQRFRKELLAAKRDKPYLVVIRFFFEAIENDGYPAKAKSRYKKFDTGNHLKLLEDVLKDAMGIDDSQHIVLVLMKDKKGASEAPHANIWIYNLEEESTPFDFALGSLS